MVGRHHFGNVQNVAMLPKILTHDTLPFVSMEARWNPNVRSVVKQNLNVLVKVGILDLWNLKRFILFFIFLVRY